MRHYSGFDIPRQLIRDNKSTAQPAHICVVDTETVAEEWSRKAWCDHGIAGVHPDDYDGLGPVDTSWRHHRLRLGVARLFRLEHGVPTRRKELVFKEAKEFWQWLDANRLTNTPTWLFAHNLLFDLRVLEFPELLEQRVFRDEPPARCQNSGKTERRDKRKSQGYLILGDPPTIVSQWHEHGWKLIALDTLNWYRCSLATLGARIGIKKRRLPPQSASDRCWLNRCRVDVDILEQSVLAHFRWVKEHDLGRLRFTLAGQAMAGFRHRFMRRKIAVHGLPDVQDLERACYYGGRTEMFYRGPVRRGRGAARPLDESLPQELWSPPRGPVVHLDVHGYYAAIMASEHLPCELVEAHFPAEPVSLESARLDRTCAALVELDTREQFPLRTQEAGTLFCQGRFWTSLCGWELERALASGSVVRVRAWSRYRLAPLFAPFVDWCDGRRQAALAAGDLVAAGQLKLMPNALQGKFAEMLPAWTRDRELSDKHQWGKWSVYDLSQERIRTWRSIAGRHEEHVGRQEKSTSFCAISAFIAAAGRERLHKLRETAGRQHVLYCCTDGLYVTKQGEERLDAAGQIGQGKLGLLQRQEECASAEFFALNRYRHGRRLIQGGVKETAVELRRGVYRQLKFSGAEDLIAHGPSGGVWVHDELIKLTTKHLKGGVLDNGWIAPWTMTHAACARVGAAGYTSTGGNGSARIVVASGASGKTSAAGRPASAASTCPT